MINVHGGVVQVQVKDLLELIMSVSFSALALVDRLLAVNCSCCPFLLLSRPVAMAEGVALGFDSLTISKK